MDTNVYDLLTKTYKDEEFLNYIELFDKIYENWKDDLEGLFEKLTLHEDTEAITFLIFNMNEILELCKKKVQHDDSYYIELFNNIDSNWKKNTDQLVKKLVRSQDHDALNFLIKNYEKLTSNLNMFDKANLLHQINYYIGFCGRITLYNYGIPRIEESFTKGLYSGFFNSINVIGELYDLTCRP